MVEVPEIELESQTQSQGLGNSSKMTNKTILDLRARLPDQVWEISEQGSRISPQPPYKMTIMKKNCYSYEGLYWTPNRDWGSSLDLHSFKAALWGHQN